MSRTRQQLQSENVRNRILDIARRIISEEGAEALSIRRITKEMDYSAGIVYHYFESKEQILLCVLQEGYKKILSALKPPSNDLLPDEAFRISFLSYMESMMTWSAEYKALMLSSSPQILDFTSVLSEGQCEKNPALKMMVETLEEGIQQGIFAPCDTQLTAQVLWSASFGLLIRLIIENNVSHEQQTKLMERQIDFLLKGLRI